MSVYRGGLWPTVIIDFLETIVFDLGAGRIDFRGHVHLPAILFHNHLRAIVTALGSSVYDRPFRPAHRQKDVDAQAIVQFVVTTTTSPPGDMRTEPWSDATPGGVAEVRLKQQDR